MLVATGVGKDQAIDAMRAMSPTWEKIAGMYDELTAALEHDIANKTYKTYSLLASITQERNAINASF